MNDIVDYVLHSYGKFFFNELLLINIVFFYFYYMYEFGIPAFLKIQDGLVCPTADHVRPGPV